MFRIAGWVAANLLVAAGLCLSDPVYGQQVTIGVPSVGVSDQYGEFIGGRWIWFGPGWQLQGGTWPGSGWGGPVAGGIGGLWAGDGSSMLGGELFAGAGRSSVLTSTTPLLTVTSGYPGSIFAGRSVPLVTGVLPVPTAPAIEPRNLNIGPPDVLGRHPQQLALPARPEKAMDDPPDEPAAADPAAAREEAVERRPVVRPRAIESGKSDGTHAQQAGDLWEKGQKLEADGKPAAARILYQTALRSASGELRGLIEMRLRELQ